MSKNYRISFKPFSVDAQQRLLSYLLEVNQNSESIYINFDKIYVDNLDWNYNHDMLCLSQKFPGLTFGVLFYYSTWQLREIVYKNGKSTDHRAPKIAFEPFTEDQLKERNVDIIKKVKKDNTAKFPIDFDPVLDALKKSHKTEDSLLYHLIREFRPQIQNIDAHYFHKAFRQIDVLESGHLDMIFYDALNLSNTFWKEIEKQYPTN